jgi:hypothetical protein
MHSENGLSSVTVPAVDAPWAGGREGANSGLCALGLGQIVNIF